MAKYFYGSDLIWKNQIVRKVLDTYNEPMLNLHFLGPFLKNYTSSQNSYDLIFQLLRLLPDDSLAMVFDGLKIEIDEYKKDLIQKSEEEQPSAGKNKNKFRYTESSEFTNKILPLFHIMIYMVLNFSFSENKDIFKELAATSHELRLIPLPYGLLPHELIELIDNERILPGISRLYKLGEDFPMLNYYNFSQLEQTSENLNWH